MAESYVVQSKVRDLVKQQDLNVAGDFVDALNAEIESIIKKAVERCKGNGRKTVRATDV